MCWTTSGIRFDNDSEKFTSIREPLEMRLCLPSDRTFSHYVLNLYSFEDWSPRRNRALIEEGFLRASVQYEPHAGELASMNNRSSAVDHMGTSSVDGHHHAASMLYHSKHI